MFGKLKTNVDCRINTIIFVTVSSAPSSSTSTIDSWTNFDKYKSFLFFVIPLKSDFNESNANDAPIFDKHADNLKKIKKNLKKF